MGMSNENPAAPICCTNCRHALKHMKLSSGKWTQVRACQTPAFAASVAAVKVAMAQPGGVFGEVPADLLTLVNKVTK